MKIIFKSQAFQEQAVSSVVDCFYGQEMHPEVFNLMLDSEHQAFRNGELLLDDTKLLANIQSVQRRNGVPPSSSLSSFTMRNSRGSSVTVSKEYLNSAFEATNCHIDLEMETGTGKTFCYINTIFELNRKYGWTKFVVVVPTIAIREGVHKQFTITKEYFLQQYGKSLNYFIYNSQNINEIDGFAKTTQLTVMIINMQAFASKTKANRRIHEELDEFQSRKPIEVLSSTRPILILDEPQRMEGDATLESLRLFNPLFIIRYSATHRTHHNTIYRLDSLDAYHQKLVKRISVIGIESDTTSTRSGYVKLEKIDRHKNGLIATVMINKKSKTSEVVKSRRRVVVGKNLFSLSGGLEQYSNNYVVAQIDRHSGAVEFSNGQKATIGDVLGDESNSIFRRIQIREAIRAHIDRERVLFKQGIKVLSLFFVDRVQKYRDYERSDLKGEYARIFEEEYRNLVNKTKKNLTKTEKDYLLYLNTFEAGSIHNGYFSIDRSSKRFIESSNNMARKDAEDADAYDMILKDMERLLSFGESTRFIFSHSALREGWDNPNIFTLCMLKSSDSQVSRHQEIGRGLRICVNQHGQRMDNPSIVHELNVLTVVTNESYKEFTSGLQSELAEKTNSHTRSVKWENFLGATLVSEYDTLYVDSIVAKELLDYLVSSNYISLDGIVTQSYFEQRSSGSLEALPEHLQKYSNSVYQIIDNVISGSAVWHVEDGRDHRKNPLNSNFDRVAFRNLWKRVNMKMIYKVEFNSDELIKKCVNGLKDSLSVQDSTFKIQSGHLRERAALYELEQGMAFDLDSTRLEWCNKPVMKLHYDIIGEIAQRTMLTRHTIGKILSNINESQLQSAVTKPEHLINVVKRVVTEQMASVVIEHLSYNKIDETFSTDIFTANQIGQDFNRATRRLSKHIYDHVITDSKVERDIAYEMDSSNQIEVFAKLPKGFQIPTPFGSYNPDWAVAFKRGTVRHMYFVAETKGSISSLELRTIESAKIESAKKFFRDLNKYIDEGSIKYGVVSNFDDLMKLIK